MTEKSFRREVADFIRAHRPAPPAFKLPQSFLEVESELQLEWLRDWQRKLFDAAYLGWDVPLEYGGRGIDPEKHRTVQEELTRADAPFLLNYIALNWAGPTILRYGTEAQKKRYLPPLLRGDELWCQGFSEPEFGSDLAGVQTRARKTAEGYRVTGHKVWTTLAHASSFMILLARTDPAAGKYEGLSYFLFPMKTSGVTVQPLVKMTGEGGFNQVIFEDAKMPLDGLLGREGQGWEITMATLMFERGASEGSKRDAASPLLSTLRSLVELSRARDRGADPVFRDQVARLWIEAQAVGMSGARGETPGLVEERPLALPLMNKLVTSEWSQRASDLACEMLGADVGYWLGDRDAGELPEWPRAFQNSFGMTIGGGTSEILRNVLGERVLGLPKGK